MDDHGLLHEYVDQGSEQAFAEIVRRHADTVYAVCLRRIGDEQLAEDASQAVFLALARKAKRLGNRKTLAGWLVTSAVYASSNVVTVENRRKKHEKKMAEIEKTRTGPGPEPAWQDIAPFVDSALVSLGNRERDAVVLRFFQDRSHREIAETLAISEEAAKKRVSRALDKLRKILTRKGIAVPAVLLGTLISENAVRATPATLAEDCIAMGMKDAGTPLSGNINHIADGVMKMIVWTKIKTAIALAVLTVSLSLAGSAALETIAAPGSSPATVGAEKTLLKENLPKVVLSHGHRKLHSSWRYHVTWGSELATTSDNKPVHLNIDGKFLSGFFLKFNAKGFKRSKGKQPELISLPQSLRWSRPPEGWRAPDFDDDDWARSRRVSFGSYWPYRSIPLVCVRGRFRVQDPAKVGDMSLSVSFQGGLVVYLNGTEVARAYQPQGALAWDAPAEPYPREAYVDAKGRLVRSDRHLAKKHPEVVRLRIRRIDHIRIPAALLRAGVNVLALEVHRAPAHEIMFTGGFDWRPYYKYPYEWWSRIGISKVRLAAREDAALEPNTGLRNRAKGLRVWNHPVASRVTVNDCDDPCEPLCPIRIHGARGGVFSGQIVVGSNRGITGLKARVSPLTTPENGGIAPAAVHVRYALRYAQADGELRRWFDGLEESPRPGVRVQPIWITVRIPADARPGTYTARLSVSADNADTISVPVELTVADWRLPDKEDRAFCIGMVQSPESVAMHYEVKMWSEKHWSLISRSFSYMAELGADTVYIPLIAKTHFGNEHSMVRWIRQKDGSYQHDFSIAEKYLDTAVKRLGKVPVVCLYCWEPLWSTHHGGYKTGDRDILFTIFDPDTGKIEEATGPEWGTPECRAFWKPVMEGMKRLLEKRGLGGSMMIGMASDRWPGKGCVADLAAVAPDAPWVVHSHGVAAKVHDRPVGYVASVIGGRSFILLDPSVTRFYGWKSPLRVFRFGRYNFTSGHSLARHRLVCESCSVTGGRGLGRLGADFWPVVKGKRGKSSVIGRYSATFRWGMNSWGNLSLETTSSALLAAGRDGAIPTVRFEMIREGMQETEARIFIEKALLDPAKKARLGTGLAQQCQDLLDERVRACMTGVFFRADKIPLNPSGWLASGWQERSRGLYELAGEVARKQEAP